MVAALLPVSGRAAFRRTPDRLDAETAPQTALDLVAIAQRARSFDEYERATLERVRAGLGAEVAFFVRGEGPGPGALGMHPRVLTTTRRRWHRYGRELTPVFDAAHRSGGAAYDADVLRRGLYTTSVFTEFMAPHGGHSTLLGVLSLGGEVVGGVALGRTRSRARSSDLELLGALLPALSIGDVAARRRRSTLQGLSPREREVVRGLRLGFTNGEIARSLGTSVNTVRNQLRAVFRKLGATTRAEAVALSFGHDPSTGL